MVQSAFLADISALGRDSYIFRQPLAFDVEATASPTHTTRAVTSCQLVNASAGVAARPYPAQRELDPEGFGDADRQRKGSTSACLLGHEQQCCSAFGVEASTARSTPVDEAHVQIRPTVDDEPDK